MKDLRDLTDLTIQVKQQMYAEDMCINYCQWATKRAVELIENNARLPWASTQVPAFFFFFFTLVTGPRRSLRLKLSDTRVYAPAVGLAAGPSPLVPRKRLGQSTLSRECIDYKTSMITG